MKLLVAFSTIVTLQLCLLRANALEEQDVENQDIEMDMELARELEEYDEDDQDVEFEEDYNYLDSRDITPSPRLRPFCERAFNFGWGGQCSFPIELVNKSCDFIWPNDPVPLGIGVASLCRNPDMYCCVDCYAQRQYDNCLDIVGGDVDLVNPARRECCNGDHVLAQMDSGCNCCGRCKPSLKYCTRRGNNGEGPPGFCVTRDDPVNNFELCDIIGGTLYARRCKGRHCQCCIPPLFTSTFTTTTK